MRIFKSIAIVMLLTVLCTAAAPAQTPAYDGMTLLGEGHHFPVDGGGSLTLMAFHTKYKEPVVGFYFQQGTRVVHFYANAATWDRLKQVFIKARDQWDTMTPDLFKGFGSVLSYRIGNRQSTMRIGVQGATELSPKMLFMNVTGGPSELHRVSVHFSQKTLRQLVDDFAKIDGFLRTPASAPAPAPANQ